MIDLHFHCLPGIDDGPRTWDEAVALCRAAADADGTTDIVATPHVLRDPWLNESREEREELVRELNRRLGGAPKVWSGCEYYFGSDAYDLWSLADGPLTGLNGSASLLLEFPATTIPRDARAVFHELQIMGVTPLIAHPERNLVFASNPTELQALVDRGAQTQITAASLTGDFGRAALEAAESFIDLGLAHVVASDAHSLSRRPPALAAARDRVRSRWGEEMAIMFFETNPRLLTGL